MKNAIFCEEHEKQNCPECHLEPKKQQNRPRAFFLRRYLECLSWSDTIRNGLAAIILLGIGAQLLVKPDMSLFGVLCWAVAALLLWYAVGFLFKRD